MQIARTSRLVFHATLALIVGGGTAVVGAQVAEGGWLAGLVPLAVIGWVALRRPLRRWGVAHRPWPEAARDWLEAHVPLYAALDAAGQARFRRDCAFILDEWRFEAAGGAEVTDEARLGVAAGAALLLHGRPDWEFSGRHTILFYPDRFDDAYYDTDEADFDGMAHQQGPVIFSQRAVEESWDAPESGHNVVLHELAHLFDFDNQFADGVPSLLDPASAQAWARLVRREMQRVKVGKSMLRSYAATNEAEFFAVAVEAFFGRPEAMQRRHDELYAALVAFFGLDPLAAGSPSAAASAPVAGPTSAAERPPDPPAPAAEHGSGTAFDKV